MITDTLRGLMRPTGLALLTAFLLAANNPLAAQIVPGTGKLVAEVGDDFEDEEWSYIHNLPKSSHNINKLVNLPSGGSSNGRWFESQKRGAPDVVRRIPTPAGGLPGSKGALLLQTLRSGPSNRLTFSQQQDDFLLDVTGQLGGFVPVAWNPNVVVRVFLPPFKYWEKRTGSSFGFRAGVTAQTTKPVRVASRKLFGLFSKRPSRKIEPIYPGLFIQFHSKTDAGNETDYASIVLRGDDYGQDTVPVQIKQPGWWTLGMSFTGDGRVHYYASPGVDNLTSKDRLGSHMYSGYRCMQFNSFFFNVVNRDDGNSWSTPWVIDDPQIYFTRR